MLRLIACLEIAGALPSCLQVRFQANHWLYLENPKEFNELVVKFSYEGLAGVAALQHF